MKSFMTVKGRFTLDTNIPIYAVDCNAGHRYDYVISLEGQTVLCDCVLTV